MEKRSLLRIHHALSKYEIDENGFIYKNGEIQEFSKTFTYSKTVHKIEKILGKIFLDNPNNCGIVVFKNGDINNYHISNLEWSSFNQDTYNYIKQNKNKSSGKCCKNCKNFKSYDEYYTHRSGNPEAVCKSCKNEKRALKKDLYNERKNKRRKELPNSNGVYQKLRYEKFKENPEEYQKFLDKVKNYSKTNWWIDVLSRIKRRCIKLDLPFNLTKEDLIVPEYCPILNIPISIGNKEKLSCVSWDRIIPELGYVKGNVRAISGKANLMKLNCSFEELKLFSINIIKYINNEI